MPHPRQHQRSLLAVTVADRQQEFDDLVLHPRRHVRDHAQVDEREPPVVGEDQVARVRIGVQHTVIEDHSEVGAEQLLDDRPRIDVHQPERPDVGDLLALDPLHRQHARRREVHDRVGHHEQVIVLGQLAEGQQVAGLASVVQLPDQRPAELPKQRREPIPPTEIGALVRHLGQAGEHLHVALDDVARLGPLHLDDDLAPTRQRRSMDLSQRRRSQRLLVELDEQVPQRHPELGLDRLLDTLERDCLDVVLQPRERRRVAVWQQVEAGRQQLPQLDVGRPHRLQVARELVGLRGVRSPSGVAVVIVLVCRVRAGRELVESRSTHQVGAAVPDEKASEGGIPTGIAGGQGVLHGASMRCSRGERVSLDWAAGATARFSTGQEFSPHASGRGLAATASPDTVPPEKTGSAADRPRSRREETTMPTPAVPCTRPACRSFAPGHTMHPIHASRPVTSVLWHHRELADRLAPGSRVRVHEGSPDTERYAAQLTAGRRAPRTGSRRTARGRRPRRRRPRS